MDCTADQSKKIIEDRINYQSGQVIIEVLFLFVIAVTFISLSLRLSKISYKKVRSYQFQSKEISNI